VSCAKSVPVTSVSLSDTPLSYCFDVRFMLKGESNERLGRACYDDIRICTKAYEVVRKYGNLANITSVTECGII